MTRSAIRVGAPRKVVPNRMSRVKIWNNNSKINNYNIQINKKNTPETKALFESLLRKKRHIT